MKILVQFPTYKRKDKFLKCLNRCITSQSGKHLVTYNIVGDADDKSFNQVAVEGLKLLKFGPGHTYINFKKLENSTKISAMNYKVDEHDWDIVIAMSDDMNVQYFDWDNLIALDFMYHWPERDGCVSYSDGNPKKGNENLITLSMMGRKLYDHFGYIYHPDYASLYCDNEFTEEVNRMDKVVYKSQRMFTHDHYAEPDNPNTGDKDEAAI